MKRMKIAVSRETLGASLDIMGQVWDLHQAGGTWSDAATSLVVDKTIERYQVHIAAAFARYGVTLAPGEKITQEVLLRVINEKSGLEVSGLNQQGIMQAVDGQVSKRLSDVVGVDIGSITTVEGIKAALIESAKKAVVSGRATTLITKAVIKKIRAIKTAKNAGLTDKQELDKVLNRAAQKRYRKKHKEIYVSA